MRLPDPELLDSLDSPLLRLRHVAFRYASSPGSMFTNVNVELSMSSRVAISGGHAVGKSTLLRVLAGALDPTEGEVIRHPRVRVALLHTFAWHQLDANSEKSPVGYLLWRFGDGHDREARELSAAAERSEELWRRTTTPQIASYLEEGFGFSRSLATGGVIASLSSEQKVRLVVAALMWSRPHILILHQPSNCLDRRCLEELYAALDVFAGGVVIKDDSGHSISRERLFGEGGERRYDVWCVADCPLWLEDQRRDTRPRIGLPDPRPPRNVVVLRAGAPAAFALALRRLEARWDMAVPADVRRRVMDLAFPFHWCLRMRSTVYSGRPAQRSA